MTAEAIVAAEAVMPETAVSTEAAMPKTVMIPETVMAKTKIIAAKAVMMAKGTVAKMPARSKFNHNTAMTAMVRPRLGRSGEHKATNRREHYERKF